LDALAMAGLPLENPCLEERMDEIRERLDQIGADLKGQKELQTEPGAWLMGFSNLNFDPSDCARECCH